MKFIRILVLCVACIVVGIVLIPRHNRSYQAHEKQLAREAAMTVWEVVSVTKGTFEGDKKYEAGREYTNNWARIWIKPVGKTQFDWPEAILIVATPESLQLNRYLVIKPGDQLYFNPNSSNSDNLGGWASYKNLRLWMVVPKEKLKNYPGDIRKHPEYRFQF